jgi:hypothetical protein
MMNGKANAEIIPLNPPDEEGWDWTLAKLTDEARDIRAVLDEHGEMGSPDWTLALSMWSLQFTNFQMAAALTPYPAQRESFDALLAERRKAMDAILSRIERIRLRMG